VHFGGSASPEAEFINIESINRIDKKQKEIL
jgi:hypothetical protein